MTFECLTVAIIVIFPIPTKMHFQNWSSSFNDLKVAAEIKGDVLMVKHFFIMFSRATSATQTRGVLRQWRGTDVQAHRNRLDARLVPGRCVSHLWAAPAGGHYSKNLHGENNMQPRLRTAPPCFCDPATAYQRLKA